MYVGASLLARMPDESRTVFYPAVALAATGLTTLWLTREVVDALNGRPGVIADVDVNQFGISAVWALHAAAILAVGLTARLSWARMYALVLFAVVLIQLFAVDVWLLSTGYRTIAFIGLGVLLLGGSLLYNRLRVHLGAGGST
jgi:uncharacterized membrane protein